MNIAIISLGGWSSLQIAEECKEYFKRVDTLDLRHIDVKVGPEGLDVFYDGKRPGP